MSRPSFSASSALRRFGFRQTIKGALIIGAISSIMALGQGLAYQKSYPDQASRTKIEASLSSAPAIGILYGDNKELAAGTNGYVVWRVTGFIGLITAVWGVSAVTKLLRGSEEDGRWEVLRMSTISTRKVTAQVMTGFGLSWLAGFGLSLLSMATLVKPADIPMPFTMVLAVNLVMFLPTLLFGAVAILTSQLALTRQRAMLYALAPLAIFFVLRGIGNIDASVHWLLTLSPFGWALLVSPAVHSQMWWLAPFVLGTALFTSLGLWLAERDLESSVLRQSDTIRSHYFLLKNGWQLGLRQDTWIFSACAFGAIGLMLLMASLTNVAVSATSGSESLTRSFNKVAGSGNNIKLAFLGAGLVFLAMILQITATSIIGAIRNDEAKEYLDNILVQPRRRTTWLTGRLVLGAGVLAAISLLTGLITYAYSSTHGISLDIAKVMAISLCIMGTVGFLMGFGALMFGLLPRFAILSMYIAIGWSFLITLLSSVMTLNSTLLRSSLFHYTTFNLAAMPNWRTFAWMLGLGLVMATAGVIAFAKRDIVAE